MRPRRFATFLLVFLSSAHLAFGADLQILPNSIRLDGPKARQRLLVEASTDGVWTGDETKGAAFQSSNPGVAVVSPEGTVTPVSNGFATITASVNGQSARVGVSVENFESDEPWSFRNHVESVLSKTGCNAGACHGAAAGKNGLRLSLRAYGPEVDYRVLTRQAAGRRVVPTAPAESLLLLKPTGAIEHGGGVLFAPDSLEYRVIAEWIASGTPAPSADDPKIVALQTYPNAARLKPGQSQQILVRALFSNGREEDVTRWTRFSSTDDTIAKVDESGTLKVEAHGEATINVWYASRVQRTTITSPYPSNLDPKVFRNAPRHNPIDEKNLAKLAALGIPPSPDAGDAAFLRRAYLDATGTLPSIKTAEEFLADHDPAKRAKLIDRLLDSPEYVDYWSYKWSDLFLVSSNKLPAPAMWSFYRFVRKNVAENTPWDRLARSIITARGSTLQNGAANYFVLHRDPIDLTESTSMAFLGLALTCARCHNHPLEKWTQDQYYGVANLFARVKLKDGPSAGDVVVIAAAEGDVRHPRTNAILPPQPLDAAPVPDALLDRREAFADWLAQPENPYFTRAVVNRVWRNFFGRGLIEAEDDLRATNPPSDEALLDWLTADFRAHKLDVKHLIRTVMNSAVYARSSFPTSGNAFDGKFLSHYPVKRLPAEVLLDAISEVTEVTTTFPGYPSGWRSLQLPDSKVDSLFLTSFGRPERLNTCSCERSSEPSMSQALHLANGSTINDKLRDPKSAAARAIDAKLSDSAIIDRLFLAALTRKATDAERARLQKILTDASAGISDAKAATLARRQAIEDLYWAVLTGNEFLFNH